MERIDLSKPREEVKKEVVGLLEELAKKIIDLEIEFNQVIERSGIKDFIHYDTHLSDFEVERLLTNTINGIEHARMSLNILRYGIQYGIGKEN